MRVTGIDLLGQPFWECTATLDVNSHGCKFPSRQKVETNSQLNLELTDREANGLLRSVLARVVRVQPPEARQGLFHIAVELEVPGNVWGIALPPGDWSLFRKSSPLQISTAVAGPPTTAQATPPASVSEAKLGKLSYLEAGASPAQSRAWLVSGVEEQNQKTVPETAAAVVAAEASRLLDELRTQLQAASDTDQWLRQAAEKLSEAQQASAKVLHEQWTRKIDLALPEVSDHPAASTTEHVQRILEASQQDLVAQFVSQLQQQLMPLLEQPQEVLTKLATLKSPTRILRRGTVILAQAADSAWTDGNRAGFCIKCGAENPGEAESCWKCGKSIFTARSIQVPSSAATSLSPVPVTHSRPQPQPENEPLPQGNMTGNELLALAKNLSCLSETAWTEGNQATLCIKCGAENPGGAESCWKCGKSIFTAKSVQVPSVAATSQLPGPVMHSRPQPQPENQPLPRGSKASTPAEENLIQASGPTHPPGTPARIAGLQGTDLQAFVRTYRLMTGDQLLALAKDLSSLSETARNALVAELRRRGLEASPPQPSKPEPHSKRVGGWLALFILASVVFSPVLTMMRLVVEYEKVGPYLARVPVLLVTAILDTVVSIALMCFGIYAGVCLWKIKRNAVRIAKRYLLAYGLCLVAVSLLTLLGGVSETMEKNGWAVGTLRSIMYVLIWYAYLTKSERVAATYAVPNTQAVEAAGAEAPVICRTQPEAARQRAQLVPPISQAQGPLRLDERSKDKPNGAPNMRSVHARESHVAVRLPTQPQRKQKETPEVERLRVPVRAATGLRTR